MWKLFLDDDAGKPDMEAFRNPPIGETGWKVAHSSLEAIHLIGAFGVPSYISFDHDLGMKANGSEDTAMEVINYLSTYYYDAVIDYDVHSQNPRGKLNIISKMDSWRKSQSL